MIRFFVLLAFAIVCPRPVSAAPGDLLFTLKPPDAQPGWFGYTLAAVDGDILVGAIQADLGLPIDAMGRAYLFDGRTGKHKQTFNLPWTGNGITSSTAASNSGERAVGYADNATMPLGPLSVFLGYSVDNTDVLVRYTVWGDTNLVTQQRAGACS